VPGGILEEGSELVSSVVQLAAFLEPQVKGDMGINIGTKLFPVGVLRCEGWRWYAGKDVRVDSGYNRRVVGV